MFPTDWKAPRMTTQVVLLAAWMGVGAPGFAPSTADAAQLSSVKFSADGEVLLKLDSAVDASDVSTFTMSSPSRLVVDIVGASPKDGLEDLEGDGSVVHHAEIESFEDGQSTITRIRLYLMGPVDHDVVADGKKVKITLSLRTDMSDSLATASTGTDEEDPIDIDLAEDPADLAEGLGTMDVGDRPLSGPQGLPTGDTISSLDFQNMSGTSRVVIGLTGTYAYTTSQPRANLVVVDVPGAHLPESLGRVLDTSEFISPVRMVRAYGTSTGSRVAISLRSDADWEVQTSPDGLIYVDVTVPESMKEDRALAAQGFSVVSPASNRGEGIENATGGEVLISETGSTMSPQAAFGSGSGSLDPSGLSGMSSGFLYDTTTATSQPYSGRRISLDFVNADIHNIFRLLSHVSRLNIITGDEVQGTVTVRMIDVPWDQALAAVLQSKGLASQRFGNIIRVAPIETIKAEQQAALETKRAKEELDELHLLVLPLNYVSAQDVQEQVGPLMSARGKVQVDITSNQLIVQDTEKHLAQLRELVRVMDKETPQVLIEARVVEANTSFTRALGIQWGGEVNASTATGYSTGLFFPNSVGMSGGLTAGGGSVFYSPGQENLLVDLGPSGTNSALAFSLGSIPGLVNLDARLAAMESDGWGKVVSSPRITTLDNRTAMISQGAKIPYLSTAAAGTQVKFIDAALQMEVTPHITLDDKVLLKVSVSNNRADFSQLVQGQPAILIKEAKTELLVSNGDTTVLGGVFSTEESSSQDRTPGLSKIPLLGYLFKNSTENMQRNELLVFITPHIVTKAMMEGQ